MRFPGLQFNFIYMQNKTENKQTEQNETKTLKALYTKGTEIKDKVMREKASEERT